MNTILMLVANKTITSEAIANHIINMPGWTLASWVTEQGQLQRENLIHPPDCILLDDSFFELETVIHINLLTTQYHNAKILLIASQLDQQLFANAMDAGAKGIISPMHANLDQLSEAVGCIANGRTYLCQAAMELLVGGCSAEIRCFAKIVKSV